MNFENRREKYSQNAFYIVDYDLKEVKMKKSKSVALALSNWRQCQQLRQTCNMPSHTTKIKIKEKGE